MQTLQLLHFVCILRTQTLTATRLLRFPRVLQCGQLYKCQHTTAEVTVVQHNGCACNGFTGLS